MKAKTSRTLSDFLRALSDSDKTLKQWALEKGLDVDTVYQVANGRTKGRWGESRKVMRAMGLPVPTARVVARSAKASCVEA